MMFHIRQIKTGGFDDNFSYLFWEEESRKATLLDPCGTFEKIKTCFLKDCPADIVFDSIFLTHSHKDHLDALEEAKRFFKTEKISGHPENPFVTAPLVDGEMIPFGKEFLSVIYTPGHTKDSVSFLTGDGKGLFTGDTLFIDYCGFARDEDALFTSLQKIYSLPDKIMVYSGHDYGSVPARTLGEEKRLNPYLKAQNREEFRKVIALLE